MNYHTISRLLFLAFIILVVDASAYSKNYRIENDDILYKINDNSSPEKLFEFCDKYSKWIDFLTPGHLNELPVGLKRTIGNIEYTVAIAKAEFRPDGAYLSMFAKIKLPQKNDRQQAQTLFFGAENVHFFHDGGVPTAKLVLLGDYRLPFKSEKFEIVLKGSFDKQTGDFGDLTYFSMDCNGFKELKITADAKFSREVLIPLDDSYKPINDANAVVKSNFSTTVVDWNDWLITLSLPPFCSAKNKKIAFKVSEAVFDFSDKHNYSGMHLPACYNAMYADSNQQKLWRGFYCRELTVALPKEFKKKNSATPVSFGAKDLYIDNYGVTGYFFATGVLSIHPDSATQGDASGWAFSVDSVNVSLELDRLKAGGFSGKIQLPVSKNGSLGYRAQITKDDYLFAIKPGDTMDFAVFKAKMQLYPSSTVIFEVKDDHFKPKAILNGQIVLNFNPKDTSSSPSTDSTKALFRIPRIYFQELQLQTEQPYVKVAAAGYEGSSAMQRFPITIQKLGFSITNDEVKLNVGLRLNLMNDGNKFGAEGGFSIVGKIDNSESGRGRWRYDRFQLDHISINADLSAFSIKGSIDIYNDDPTYGDGFRGAITMKIKEGGGSSGITIDVLTYFGKKATYRYWAVDGTLTGIKIPIAPSANITGFGGGAANRMKRQPGSGIAPPMPSGIIYLPDSLIGLSLKATVFFNVPEDKVCKGSLTFEMVFNSTGGLNKIGLYGTAQVLGVTQKLDDKIKKLKDNFNSTIAKGVENLPVGKTFLEKSKFVDDLSSTPASGINLQMGIEYDFAAKSLFATAQIYLNLAGGVIKGTGSNNQAGNFEFFADPNHWHVYMGTLSNPNGISAGIGSMNVTLTNYFMAGNDVPAQSPPLPSFIVNLLGDEAKKLSMVRDNERMQSGSALCFGAAINVPSVNLDLGVLYGSFTTGLGFDIMMRKYGKGAHCAGSSAEFGMHDWYLMGQAYAYMGAEIGLKWKSKTYTILKGSAAAIMQARLPNPSWFMGYIYGQYEILGGLVKDNFDFKIELGTFCNIEYGEAEVPGITDARYIENITPMNDEEEVDVYAKPEVYFSTEINKEHEYEDGRGITKFKFKLDEFSFKYGASFDSVVAGTIAMSADNKKAVFSADTYFPEDRLIQATARVAMYEVKNGQDVLMMSDGFPVADTFKVQFRSGFLPQRISLNNIGLCYPIPFQNYVYLAEDSQAYLNLRKPQNWVFPDSSVCVFAFTDGTDMYSSRANLSGNKMNLNYLLPKALKNRTRYTVKLIRVQQSLYSDTIPVKDYLDDTLTVTLLEYDFSTSAYNTFVSKVQAMTFTSSNIERPVENSDVLILGANINSSEPFDYTELTTKVGVGSKTMISIVAKVDAEPYFQTQIAPLIYPDQIMNGFSPLTAELHYPPVKEVYLLEAYKAAANEGGHDDFASSTFPFSYNLVPAYKRRYIDFRYEIVNQYIGTTTILQYDNLVNSSFPNMPKKSYEVLLQYRLPNGALGTSAIFNFKNDLKE
jgi:hypothetical protein